MQLLAQKRLFRCQLNITLCGHLDVIFPHNHVTLWNVFWPVNEAFTKSSTVTNSHFHSLSCKVSQQEVIMQHAALSPHSDLQIWPAGINQSWRLNMIITYRRRDSVWQQEKADRNQSWDTTDIHQLSMTSRDQHHSWTQHGDHQSLFTVS